MVIRMCVYKPIPLALPVSRVLVVVGKHIGIYLCLVEQVLVVLLVVRVLMDLAEVQAAQGLAA